jgi:NAD(P)-dependent dehydrogenase (short-subunit alcohol dehydrogenase family)
MKDRCMSRTYVVTGSASGIGLATKKLLEERGNKVIGVDLHDADVVADLSCKAGRQHLVCGVAELSGGVVDGVVAVAGISVPSSVTARVNYFGAVATLEGLRSMLAKSAAPRAVAVSSFALIWPVNQDLMAALEAGDEDRAVAIADTIGGGIPFPGAKRPSGGPIYFSSKRALVHWVRRTAPTSDWAGAGIALNVIAPGMVITPLTAHMLGNEDSRKASEAAIPRPLNGSAEPIVVARLLAWLASEENSHLCGQLIFIDGGAEAISRGEHAF